MSSTWNNNVKLFTDGVDKLKANGDDGVNPVITALVERDQFLFDQLNSYSDKTILLSYNMPLDDDYAPGTPVYFDTAGGQPILKGAKTGYESMDDNGLPVPATAAHLIPRASSFVFGLVKQIYAGDPGPIQYGDVYVRGLIDDENIDFSTLLDTQSLSEGTLVPGPLYLSNVESGKLTLFPGGAAVFVGYYLGAHQLVLAPNVDSLNQLYFNYHVFLRSVAAATAELASGTWSLSDSTFDVVGWVDATEAGTEYGIDVPDGARFFYNVPTNAQIALAVETSLLTQQEAHDAYLFKRAMPAHPLAYTQLFSNGVLQTMKDGNHANGPYLIDENGLWWMDNADGYVPWSDPPEDLVLQLFINKLNPNYSSSVVTSLRSNNSTISITDENGLESSTGDLRLELNLNIVPVVTNPGSGTGMGLISFDKTSGTISAPTIPVINTITTGPGLNCDVTNGQALISLDNYKLSDEVTDIEPEEAEYVFKGLHSYLRVKRPTTANQRIGFVGKFKLPSILPTSSDLAIRLDCFADGNAPGTGTTASFVFEYSTSYDQSSISNAITTGAVTIDGAKFVSLKQGTIHKNSGLPATPYFIIPANKLTPSAYVNFRIARTYDVGSTYANPIGIIGVNWIIE